MSARTAGVRVGARKEMVETNISVRPDQRLVGLFLKGYNEKFGTAWEVQKWADQIERNKKAVEAIAHDRISGKTLAIEHTLIQPFEGEKDDAQKFLAAFECVERERLRGYLIEVSIPVGAVPKGKGIDWIEIGKRFREWFYENKAVLPLGATKRSVPGLLSDLSIEKTEMGPDYPGRVFVGRSHMPENFPDVIRKALGKKLDKLLRFTYYSDAADSPDGRLLGFRGLWKCHYILQCSIVA